MTETASGMNSTNEIETRIPIWLGLSGLYLDTKLSETEINNIVKSFMKSPFTYSAIKRIDLLEVLPALWRNHEDLAGGEYYSFDEGWLIQECKKNYEKKDEFSHKIKCRYLHACNLWFRIDYWYKIKRKMNAKSKIDRTN